MDFTELGLHRRILDAIEQQGYTNPTPIQQQAIPPALDGRDILGCAQTGTGKTAAFAMPILTRLSKDTKFDSPNGWAKPKKVYRLTRALVLSPTRELSIQIYESFRTYGKYLKLKCGLIIGGVSQYQQLKTLELGVDILVATPGRLIDLYNQGQVELNSLEIFVLDEADRMLDMGFIADVKKIINIIPKKRQTLFFTATMPHEVEKLANSMLTNPVGIAVDPVCSTTELVSQLVYLTDRKSKGDLLIKLLSQDASISTALIFTRTKYGADKLAKRLIRSNINAMAIHGDKSQGARQNALNKVKSGDIRVLVATDIASRGIDIEELSHVINYELPNIAETYVHRIGRTGRAGNTGIAISLCDFDEMQYLKDIQRLIGKKIQTLSDIDYPQTVFEKYVPPPRPPRPQKGQQGSFMANKRRHENKKDKK